MEYYLSPILAVAIGVVFVALFKPSEKKNLKLLLAFSGAFLLSVTVFELIPAVFASNNSQIGLFVMIGILLQIILEFFSKGAEHGHVHLSKGSKLFPWLLFFSLSIHAVLEGFPLYDSPDLLYAIIVHKIPIAIILTSFFYASELPKAKMLLFLLLFALMTPLGSYLSGNVPGFNEYHPQITAIVIGIFLHISTTILFESNEGHNFNLMKLLVIVGAILIAYFI